MKFITKIGVAVVLFLFLTLTGCEKKSEPANDQQQTTPPTTQTENPPPVETTPELKIEGAWKGTFWNKAMTLTITKQDGDNFEGETVVNWNPPLKQKIKGTWNAKTKVMNFEDSERNKDAGQYTGTLSEDLKSFTGEFSLNSNPAQKFKISLKMQ